MFLASIRHPYDMSIIGWDGASSADRNDMLYDPSGRMYEYGNALTASAFDGTESILRLLLTAIANLNHPQG